MLTLDCPACMEERETPLHGWRNTGLGGVESRGLAGAALMAADNRTEEGLVAKHITSPHLYRVSVFIQILFHSMNDPWYGRRVLNMIQQAGNYISPEYSVPTSTRSLSAVNSSAPVQVHGLSVAAVASALERQEAARQ